MKIFSRGWTAAAAALVVMLAGCNDRAVIVREPAAQLVQLGPAPSWTLTDLAGKTVSSADYAGKVVVVDFWATWCAPCREEIPGYIALQKKYADQGLVILGVSMDQQGADVVKPFAENFGINYPLFMGDAELADAFGGVEYLPTAFLIDRQGQIRHKKIGAMSHEEYEQLLKPLL